MIAQPIDKHRTSAQESLRRARCVVVVLIVGIGCVRARADEPRVTAKTADGDSHTGRLVSLNENEAVIAGDAPDSILIALDDLASMEFESSATPEAKPWLLLANGDRLDTSLKGIADEAFLLEWSSHPSRPAFRAPLETVTGVILQQPESARELRSLLHELSRGVGDVDTLVLTDGSRLNGELVNLADDQFQLETSVGSVLVESDRVRAVALNASLVSFPAAEGPTAVIHFTDGSWLSLQHVTIGERGQGRGSTLFGEPVDFPVSMVARIDFSGPRVVRLSDVEPARVSVTPYLSREHAIVRNRNVRGGFLRLRGREYPRGLGMTSGMKATYRLDGAYSMFQAVIGIDDDADRQGSVVFTVEVDGKRVYESPPITGRDAAARTPRINLTDASELTLGVEFGDFGNIQDLADWCNPILIR